MQRCSGPLAMQSAREGLFVNSRRGDRSWLPEPSEISIAGLVSRWTDRGFVCLADYSETVSFNGDRGFRYLDI